MDEDAPDQLVIYKQIVELLKPGETVLKVGVVSCMWVWLVAMVTGGVHCAGYEASGRKWWAISPAMEKAERSSSR